MSQSEQLKMSPTVSLAAELRLIAQFADLPEDALEWLAAHMQVVELEPGELFFHAGAPADRMLVILEGELRGQHESGADDGRVFVSSAGQITGMLPYSRLTVFPLASRAVPRTRVATLAKELFPEMLQRIPPLGPRLVALMSDRIRTVTRDEQQREKLASLGKISAGLAHELNNPAAAAARAAESLRESVSAGRNAYLRLDRLALTGEQRAALAGLEQRVLEWAARHAGADSDPLERSDREQALGACLERHGIADAWALAATLADAGANAGQFEAVAGTVPPEALGDVICRITASLLAGSLVDQIENSTRRISELVKAVKEYTYMDQGPQQEVDIHAGLDNTLLILRHRLKHGVEVVREYDRTLPRICAHGSELNQVWTNLIVNAIDAMGGKGELRIRTSRAQDSAMVEIVDNGPGIPPEVRAHLFEPFFTTKGVGEGTGLGLDTAKRIVRQHHGQIRVETRPGETNFQVTLPVSLPKRDSSSPADEGSGK
jgi:signal transduction histidine kinase